ncbi:tripartite tricarboxylate transporter TctB family protein [Agrococcus sp. ARC_14]|uniref:tripartite tricarboxylate transporter TctB family protein n=1 Tax=Agrococcus sp. ARC_14 TaxID=2919927 RepID=UPI001F050717|nr:tripartite tricarboxylate transporter TctB family protein [Agrococcus sp. ARC_14]MCH1883964.1 tripartite tricarboxylate transporter TctB family protein [Agrococcus sp. ARC_14]
MLGRKRDDRGRKARPGLETTEMSVMEKAELNAPPPPDAFTAGAYPAVLSGATTALVGAIMTVIAILVLVDASQLPPASDPLGPAAFPILIGSLLGIVGLALAIGNHRYALVLLRVRRGGVVRRGRGWSTVLVLVALLVFAALLPLVGFFLAAALLYIAVALLLGAPRGWHLVITAVLLAGVVVLLFDRIIGLTLPAGPWGF